MAIFFHSNLNRTIIADYGWAFTQYLETVAILSQFILFTKKVEYILILGWRDLDIYITFCSITSNFKNIIHNILGIYIHIIKLIK